MTRAARGRRRGARYESDASLCRLRGGLVAQARARAPRSFVCQGGFRYRSECELTEKAKRAVTRDPHRPAAGRTHRSPRAAKCTYLAFSASSASVFLVRSTGCVATADPRRLSRGRSNFSAELAAPARPDRAIGTGQGSRVAIRLRVDLGSTRCAESSTQRLAHERVKIRPVARRPRPQPRSLVAWDRWWPRERVRPIQTDPRPTESGFCAAVGATSPSPPAPHRARRMSKPTIRSRPTSRPSQSSSSIDDDDAE